MVAKGAFRLLIAPLCPCLSFCLFAANVDTFEAVCDTDLNTKLRARSEGTGGRIDTVSLAVRVRLLGENAALFLCVLFSHPFLLVRFYFFLS